MQSQLTPKCIRVGPDEPYDVFIGRPSEWGNPFWDGTKEENIMRFTAYIGEKPGMLERVTDTLAGKRIACYCAKTEECHGDVLVAIANGVMNFL